MKKVKDVQTSRQRAVWIPEKLLNELLKLADAKGIQRQRRDTTTAKDLIKELSIEEAKRLEIAEFDEKVVRYAKMGIK